MVCARKGVALEINTSHLQSNQSSLDWKEALLFLKIYSMPTAQVKAGILPGCQTCPDSGPSVSQISKCQVVGLIILR